MTEHRKICPTTKRNRRFHPALFFPDLSKTIVIYVFTVRLFGDIFYFH